MTYEELMLLDQCPRILVWLQDHKGITQLEATRELNITRLSARISDFKEAGYAVSYIWEEHTNKFGKKSRYKRYFVSEVA